MSLTIMRLFMCGTFIICATTGGLAPVASNGCQVPVRVQPTARSFVVNFVLTGLAAREL